MTPRKTARKKATHSVVFRLASQRWLSDEWFGHRQEKNRDILELMATDIVRSVDSYRSRNWEIQSSVDGGKSWQTQGNVAIAW